MESEFDNRIIPPGVARVSTERQDRAMTRKEWRDTVLRDDWDTITDAERARRIEAAMNPGRAAAGPQSPAATRSGQ